MTHQSGQSIPTIDTSRCSGCGRCVAACPQKIITLETLRHRKHATIIRHVDCITCYRCLTACPLGAISTTPLSP